MSPLTPRPRRLRACVDAWPDCYEGGYDPACCRFPKSCSCDIYDEEHITGAQLEPAHPVRAFAAAPRTVLEQAAVDYVAACQAREAAEPCDWNQAECRVQVAFHSLVELTGLGEETETPSHPDASI